MRLGCRTCFRLRECGNAWVSISLRLRSRIMSEAAKPSTSQPLVPIAKLAEFIAHALAAAGVPQEDGVQVAQLRAEADARGWDAHGVFRLPQYVKQIESGAVNPRPNIQ